MAALELALHAVVPATALRNADLSIGARIALLAYGLTAAAAAACAVGVPLLLLTRVGRSSALVIWAARGVKALVLWVALLVYGSSWASYWTTGAFLDREALVYWLPEPVQVFHWVYPPVIVAVLGLTLAAALALGWWVPRWAAARAHVVQRRLVLTAAGGLAVLMVVAMVGDLVYGEELAADGSSSYEMARDDRAGPFLHVLAELREPAVPTSGSAARAAQTITVERRPIVSMAQYMAGVDRSRIKPWNVVMIQIESLRADQLRAYGGTRDVLPNVDRLSRDSTVFTNAYIQASHSNYADMVPLSSHYPLRYPQMYSYVENPPYPRVMIYELLKAAGYKTGVFSSQNENWGGMIYFHKPASLDKFFHAAVFSGPTYAPWEDAGFADWVKATRSAGSVDDRYTTDEAIKWIDSVAGSGSPFFVHMNLQSSHLPYVLPADFPRRFGPATLDFSIVWATFPRDKISVVKDRYADSLFYEDTQIGRLLDLLRRRNILDHTIVVIGGDNGEAFYEHGFAAHASSVFNEVMKVPMVFHVPGKTAVRDDRPAMFLDVPPSILDLVGLPPHPGFQGISLFEPQPNPNRSIFMMVQTVWAHQVAMVQGAFKLFFSERDGRYVLFDLMNDPGETMSLTSTRPDLVESMGGRLQLWREAQLKYYADPQRQATEYPPVLPD
ncbi:MAG: sulfatase [Vicinamibacterales bacterium]